MNIGIYTRKSVFSDKSDSTESQAKICTEYANNNYSVSSIIEYEDEGFTGANTNRPGFVQLMEDISNKSIDVLVCYKMDRISRNVLDFSKTFEFLEKNNVKFISVKEQIDTSTPLGRAMMYICSVFAQMERETTAERVRDSMIQLARSGKWAGGKPPIGFSRKKVILNGKTHTMLTENVEELPFLNMIYDTFLGGYTLSGLETYFRQSNVKTLNGNYLSATQLYSILKNPHYVACTPEVYDYFESKNCIMAVEKDKFDGLHGVVVYGRTTGSKKKAHTVNTSEKWIVTVGLHDPIMSGEKWLLVQNRFGLNTIDRTRKHEIGLLKGIVKCKCGYSMRVQHKVDKIYNKVYDNYFCQQRNRMGTDYCDVSMVGVELIDDKLMEMLKKLSTDKFLLEELMKENNKPVSYRTQELVLKEIAGIEKKISNLALALQENGGSSASKYIISDIEKLDMSIVGLNSELREIKISEKDRLVRENTVDEVYLLIREYIDNFNILDYDEKITFLRKILKVCTWDGKKLSIVM